MVQKGDFSASKKVFNQKHSHEPQVFEFLYVGSGSGIYIMGDKNIHFTGGEFFLTPPETEHYIITVKNREELNLFSILAKIKDSEHLYFFSKEARMNNPLTGNHHTLHQLQEIRNKYENSNPYMKLSSHYHFLSLIYQLFSQENLESRKEGLKYDNIHIRKCMEYIEENLFNPFSLSDLALHLNLSEEYLIRIFKKNTGTTPMKYLMKLKIENARKLLIETTMSIKEISWQLKFTDQYHFSRVFKSYTSQSPTQYRKRYYDTSIKNVEKY